MDSVRPEQEEIAVETPTVIATGTETPLVRRSVALRRMGSRLGERLMARFAAHFIIDGYGR